MSAEIGERSDFSTVDSSRLADTGLVAPDTKPSGGKSINAPTRQGPPVTLPQSGTLYPLRNQMRLVACLLSGNTMKQEEYRSQLLDCSWHPGEEVLRNSTPVHQKMDSILSPKENQSSSTTCKSSLGFSFCTFCIFFLSFAPGLFASNTQHTQ